MQVETLKEGDLHSLLSQILDELRAIRGLLEDRAGAPAPRALQQATDTAVGTSTTTPTVATDPVRCAESFLHRYLTGRQLRIVEFHALTPENPVQRERMRLAYFMGQHYAIVRLLLEELRATLQCPRPIFLDLMGMREKAISVLTNTGKDLLDLYMLQAYEYHRKERCIRVKVRPQPFAHNYLSGGWFELYVAQEAQKLLGSRLLTAKRNVKLEAQGGAVCEADLLLVVQGPNHDLRVAVLECKSANALYDEEPRQVKRLNSLLNLGMQRSAVVFPDAPSPAFAERWFQETGSQIIGCGQLKQFLQSL
ncbi:MAG: hypothetical protein N2651_01385 [Fimbriimonadales bacterium]|nr:hypothetical protein [Fimbriimonadales bacterium]